MFSDDNCFNKWFDNWNKLDNISDLWGFRKMDQASIDDSPYTLFMVRKWVVITSVSLISEIIMFFLIFVIVLSLSFSLQKNGDANQKL